MKTPTEKLIGTWRSDSRMTFRYHAGYLRANRQKRKIYRKIFGKLTLRYTKRYVYITLNGDTTRERYEVIAEDAESVVLIVQRDEARKKFMRQNPMALEFLDFRPGLSTVTFVSKGRTQYYWVGVNGVFCEWFKRQPTMESIVRLSRDGHRGRKCFGARSKRR